MRKSIELEINTELFRQLAEHSKSITEDIVFQCVDSYNGKVKFRVVVFDDNKFEEVMDYVEASESFVPLNFEQFTGNRNPISDFKELHVTFMKPLRYYGIFGISYIYRMITKNGDLLFWITEKALEIEEGSESIISGKVKKFFEYHQGGTVNQIYYVKVKS